MRGVVLGLGSFALEPFVRGQASGMRKPRDHRTSLHQEIDLKAPAAAVEARLLGSKEFSAFTRLAATIDPTEGGAFSLFGGLIVGRNVEIVPATRIVQAWRPSHWEPGDYSVVRFALKAHGESTTVVLDHTGFPEGDYDHLFSGWQAHYWGPLKTLFG